jgi:hypothetical protein
MVGVLVTSATAAGLAAGLAAAWAAWRATARPAGLGASRVCGRVVVLATVVLSSSALAGVAVSQPAASQLDGRGSASVSGAGGTITWMTEGGSPPSRTPGGPARSGASGPSGGPVYYASVPAVAWDGHQLCFTSRSEAYPSQAEATAVTAGYEQTWILGVSRYPACSTPTVSGPPPASSPAVTAAQWWQAFGSARLPKPAPLIAPGYALAGQVAYLETRMPLRRQIEATTPLGPLAISATATLWVDWGDGAGWSGPYATGGGPWPTGQLTHTWTSAGTVRVSVGAAWTAVWSLGGASGTLSTLATSGSIGGFQVRQLESLRDR